MEKHANPRTKNPWKSILAGSISGSASVLVCHPLDVLRTRIQLTKQVMPTLTVSSLYRGIFPPLCAQSLYKAVIFGSNTLSHTYLLPSFNHRFSPTNTFLSGLIAGTIVSFIVAPVEYIRTQQIVNTSAKHLFSSHPLSLWRNITPTILRDGPGVGFYFLVFEGMKNYFSQRVTIEDRLPLSYRIGAACCAGVSFWLWALPFDNAKTVMEASTQHTRASFISTCKQLYREGGLKRFYQSWPIAIARGIPSAAVTLTTFEYLYDKI